MDLFKNYKKELDTIEEEFVKIDKETNTACIQLEFEKPGDLFADSINAKIPMMTDEFLNMIVESVLQISDKYKVRFDVSFDDMEEWDEDSLAENFRKNILLMMKITHTEEEENNRLAAIMALTGIAFILILQFVNRTWSDGSYLCDLVSYMLDIVATVPFWGAMDIYFIGNRERREKVANVSKRFDSITFHKKAS